MATYLDRILDAHRRRARDDSRSVDRLRDRRRRVAAHSWLRRCHPSARVATGPDLVAVIAEIKRRSPSKGDLFPDLDPAAVARQYAVGGAACLSVLTDDEFFGGSASDLQAAREAVALPVLRKDFTVSVQDVVDTRLMGADAVSADRRCAQRQSSWPTSTPSRSSSGSTRSSRCTTKASSNGRRPPARH